MKYLDQFNQQQILVFGDLIADIYEYGIIHRMSREAPIPIVELESERVVPGGAGNVSANITSLTGCAIPVSVIGEDESGLKLLALFKTLGIKTEMILGSKKCHTTTKRRILAQGEHTIRQQVLRLDRIPDQTLAETNLAELWDKSLQTLPLVKAIIFSDYHLPLVPIEFMFNLLAEAKKAGKFIVVDSRHRLKSFVGASLITPNRSEAEEALGREIKTTNQLESAGKEIMNITGAPFILITLGDEGMALFEADQKMQLIPAFNRQEVFDVSGAGDTVVAAITLGLMAGMSPITAANFANIAAGLVVKKLGTATISLEEITPFVESIIN